MTVPTLPASIKSSDAAVQNDRTRKIIGVHLDLKGVQFRPEYLTQLLSDLASQGVNTVLVEYEEVFPFEGLKIATDAQVVWSPQFLQDFLQAAREHGIEVIPLQQCLGHLEYLLAWERYRKFALNATYPSTIDIHNPQAKQLVFDMLRQVLAAHPDSRYVHLGLDEAWALVQHAQAHGEDITRLVTDHLGELCDICEAAGKTPVIWSDMLEDHISPESLPFLESIKERVVLCCWDYASGTAPSPSARIGGARITRDWLKAPAQAPVMDIGLNQKYVEDLPPAILELIEPYRRGAFFQPMFQADIWTKLGFRVLGASAIRASKDRSALPFYNMRSENIRAWSEAIHRTDQLGQIATSWARGNSWCAPNCLFDLSWPLIGVLGDSMGAAQEEFFPGIEPQILDRLIQTLGRCREDWRIETAIAREMEELEPQLQAHQFEWRSIILMTRVLDWQRRAEYAVLEVDDFYAACRPVDTQWQRRLDEQTELKSEAEVMREKVRAHFSQRYYGAAFEEWLSTLFDARLSHLERCADIATGKLALARKTYAA